MSETTNPRKISKSGGLTVVSLPPGFLAECDLERGDQVILEAGDHGFTARKVQWEVA